MNELTIGEFCRTGSGGTPSRRKPEYFEGIIPWIKSGDLRESEITSATEFISEEGLQNSSAKLVEAGSILIAMYGATVGRMAMLGIKAATNQAVCHIEPDPSVACAEYVYHALQAKVPLLVKQAVGGAQPNISQAKIRDTKLWIPKLSGQKRIVAILDKANEIRHKRQQAIELTGRLIRSVFLDIFGDPIENSKGWDSHPLVEIAQIQTGPFGTQLHKEEYTRDGIPVINPIHIQNGKICPHRDLTITVEKSEELVQYQLQLHDLVLGRRGEMGRCALVTEKEIGWVCGTGSLIIRHELGQGFSVYLQRFFSSSQMKRLLESRSQGATLPNLNQAIVGGLTTPIPDEISLSHYRKIEQQIDRTLKNINRSQGQLEQLSKSLGNEFFES